VSERPDIGTIAEISKAGVDISEADADMGLVSDRRPATRPGTRPLEHGVEVIGSMAMLDVIERLATDSESMNRLRTHAHLVVLPVVNPDAFFKNMDKVGRGERAWQRCNANGVDLNRNFPYGWQPLESPGALMYSGPGALSEPESKLAVDFLNKIRPAVSIWYHQHLDLVDLSGGDASLEQRYAAMVGLKTEQLQRYPGSVTSWENHAFPGSTAFVVELPAGSLSDAAANRYAAAALKIV